MSQQTIPLQSPQLVNQPQNQAQNIPPEWRDFEDGRALFQRIQQNGIQEYARFRRLSFEAMLVQAGSLQIWRNLGGPQNQDEMEKSALYIENLTKIRRQKQSNIIPEFVFAFGRWTQSLLSSDSSSLKKKSEQGQSYKLVQSSEANGVEQETKRLKQE